MFSEAKYAVTSFFSILSGFEVWEQKKFDGEWEEVELDEVNEIERYYVCARYKNGRHIPLPILEDGDRLQSAAIIVALKIREFFCINTTLFDREIYINFDFRGHNYDLSTRDWPSLLVRTD